MNIREDIRQLKTDNITLRNFGLLVGLIFVIIGLVFFFWNPSNSTYFIIPGGLLLGFGILRPQALRLPYILWMSLAFVLGFFIAHLILTVFFYLVVTPLGLLSKMVGKDFLNMKIDRQAMSYWLPRQIIEKSPSDYERQF